MSENLVKQALQCWVKSNIFFWQDWVLIWDSGLLRHLVWLCSAVLVHRSLIVSTRVPVRAKMSYCKSTKSKVHIRYREFPESIKKILPSNKVTSNSTICLKEAEFGNDNKAHFAYSYAHAHIPWTNESWIS